MDTLIPRLCALVILLSAGLATTPAAAADPCLRLPASALQSADVPTRIAAVACGEHRLWYRPLIDADGRIGSMGVREAERSRLVNGTPAWQRVVEYWRDSGLLWNSGGASCAYGDVPTPSCRVFVIDTPWSAAFLSWVMRQAAVPGFNGSASHLNYVRRAYREPMLSPYRVANPQAAQVRTGDMLCNVRGSARMYGFNELAAVLSANDPALAMHCDVVVGTGITSSNERSVFLVGGNVLDSVTMRRLRLTPGDRFDNLPMRQASDPECSPESLYACDLNRQDWSVLLQLRPSAELASLAPPLPVAPVPTQSPAGGTYAPRQPTAWGSQPLDPATSVPQAPSTPRCCNHCDPEVGLPRCPAAPKPD